MTETRPITNGCASCYGTGELVTETGPVDCPDCMGVGRTPRGEVIEWRLRDVERIHTDHTNCVPDIRWLIFELRRHRKALLDIFTRCQDLDDTTLAAELRHLANTALDLYPIERNES